MESIVLVCESLTHHAMNLFLTPERKLFITPERKYSTAKIIFLTKTLVDSCYQFSTSFPRIKTLRECLATARVFR